MKSQTFTCNGCGEEFELPAPITAEHDDGEVCLFHDEDCASGWIEAHIISEPDEKGEVDITAAIEQGRQRRRAHASN
jgi:hypothetical protein